MSCCCCFYGGVEDKEVNAETKLGKKVVEAPVTQRFLHCEYMPFPGDLQPVQTDIVLYGRLAAKIFTDQLEPKIVQAWHCEDLTWVSWSNWYVILLMMVCYHHSAIVQCCIDHFGNIT